MKQIPLCLHDTPTLPDTQPRPRNPRASRASRRLSRYALSRRSIGHFTSRRPGPRPGLPPDAHLAPLGRLYVRFDLGTDGGGSGTGWRPRHHGAPAHSATTVSPTPTPPSPAKKLGRPSPTATPTRRPVDAPGPFRAVGPDPDVAQRRWRTHRPPPREPGPDGPSLRVRPASLPFESIETTRSVERFLPHLIQALLGAYTFFSGAERLMRCRTRPACSPPCIPCRPGFGAATANRSSIFRLCS